MAKKGVQNHIIKTDHYKTHSQKIRCRCVGSGHKAEETGFILTLYSSVQDCICISCVYEFLCISLYMYLYAYKSLTKL